MLLKGESSHLLWRYLPVRVAQKDISGVGEKLLLAISCRRHTATRVGEERKTSHCSYAVQTYGNVERVQLLRCPLTPQERGNVYDKESIERLVAKVRSAAGTNPCIIEIAEHFAGYFDELGITVKGIAQRGILMRRLWTALFLVCFSVLAICLASATGRCTPPVPRTIGPFGAMDTPPEPVGVTDAIRKQLPGSTVVREVIQTHLAPSGEQVILFDSGDGGDESNPRVSVLSNNAVKATFEIGSLVEYGKYGVYITACEFDLSPTQKALAAAYITSGDGSGSAFVIFAWEDGKYQAVFKRTVGQGRIVFGTSGMKIWEATFGKYASRPDSPKFECIWCRHRYKVTAYEWRDGEYVEGGSKLTTTMFDPGDISGTPFVIEKPKSNLVKP